MKKILATLLATMFVLTGFGLTTVFSGVIAGAEFYDYYIYTKLPGFSNFTDEELAMFQATHAGNGYNESIDGIGNVVSWPLTTPDQWGGFRIYSIWGRNLKAGNHSNKDVTNMPDPDWAAQDTINGKTIMGDYSFEDQNGIAMWVGINGRPYTGKFSITLKKVPSAGVFFTGIIDEENPAGSTVDQLQEGGQGFSYESIAKYPDEDGYVHFDFKTDFKQVDWWSKDDDGINRSVYEDSDGDGIPNGNDYVWPVPQSKYKDISGFTFSVGNADVGDVISIGDVRMYRDSRIYLDEIDELLLIFEEKNPEQYTAESFDYATDKYLIAYELYLEEDPGDKYTQKEIDAVAAEFRAAINALQPLFPKRSETVSLNGFEVFDEADIEAITDGGSSWDMAYLTDEVLPDGANVNSSIAIIGGASAGEPSYGWSNFQTTVEGDEGPVAVKNLFGADNLDTAAGIRLWFKPDETYTPAPTSVILGLGSSANGVAFETDDGRVTVPENGGYIYAPWFYFFDLEGESDIYDYINELDYMYVKVYDCAQAVYYIADLHAFDWSITSADFTELDETIVDTQAYLASLDKAEWSTRSWQRVEIAIEAGRALHETYGTDQDDVIAAISAIESAVLRLTPIRGTATLEEVNALENAYASATDYWSGNYVPATIANLRALRQEIAKYIEDEMSSEDCRKYTEQLEEAIAALRPITHSSLVTSIYSFETMSSRDFAKANGHRTETVDYELVTSKNSALTLPAGYDKALHMTSTADKTTYTTDEHGNMQFKLFDSYGQCIKPDIDDPQNEGNKIGATIGNLTGTAGLRFWVGINDVNLFKDATLRFGVSNCSEGPLFERHAVDIPFPSTGSGWVYLPWEYFEYYDEWTHGELINLLEIRFYIIRVDGTLPKDAELYVTGISAYVDPIPSENEAPVITNVSEGDTIDVSAGDFIPNWSVGSASLNGKRFDAGSKITVNGDYTLKVINGDKSASVSFTVVGGQVADQTPIVTGVANGEVYEDEVTIKWDIGTATLNGVAIESGIVVSESGSYTLEVVNGSKSVVISFGIKGENVPDKSGAKRA